MKHMADDCRLLRHHLLPLVYCDSIAHDKEYPGRRKSTPADRGLFIRKGEIANDVKYVSILFQILLMCLIESFERKKSSRDATKHPSILVVVMGI